MVSARDLIGRKPPAPEAVREAFELFIEALNNKISCIQRVRVLYFPGPGEKQPLWGCIIRDRIYIWGNCAKKIATRTLIHELAHFVFELSGIDQDEEIANKIEENLWKAFSRAQKNRLWSYIPAEITLDNIENEPQ